MLDILLMKQLFFKYLSKSMRLLILGVFFGIFFSSYSFANATVNPFGKECDSTFNMNGGNQRECANDYAKRLGGTDCPGPESHGSCMDVPWNGTCIRNCLIYEGDKGISPTRCSSDNPNAPFPSTVRCHVHGDFFNNEWPGIEAEIRNGCDICMNVCWFSLFYGKVASIDQCANEGVGAPGGKPCKASINPDAPPKKIESICPNVYINDWKSTRPSPADDGAMKQRLCEVGCDLFQTNKTDQERTNCKNTCLAKPSVKEASNYLKSIGATPEQIAIGGEGIITEIISIFSYANIDPISFGQIPGGFGCKPDATGKNCVGVTNINDFLKDVWSVGSILFGGLAILKIVFAGVMYATAAGNAQRTSSAKEHLLYAIIGLVVIILANIILSILGVGENLLP